MIDPDLWFGRPLDTRVRSTDTTTVTVCGLRSPDAVFADLLAALRRLGPPTQAPLELRLRVARSVNPGEETDDATLALVVRCAVRAWCGVAVPIAATAAADGVPGVDVTLVRLAGPSLRRAP